MMSTQHSDYELITQYLKGNEKAFEALVKRYTNVMYRFVFSYVKNQQAAEDVTQEVFVKVWRNAKKIDKNKSFKSWLYAVAKNSALDYLKKKQSVPFSRFEVDSKNILAEKLADPARLPDQMAQHAESSVILSRAIAKLSEKYRQVMTLYYYQYFNFREIAEILDEPINTIKSRHRRGVVMLGRMIAP